ncbi:MAG: response regulator transcription factor [Candidatus Pseudomonas phytovorans]|uniref:Response regulator transcription factor n=1 Tax=Candidatus Pseudomonas phytovorans TaxID=3121377 RepID=A0AAJ5WHI6_9PSED|nr:response regulator transcription factor [Pseudomonas sp.]WEK29822.1 MAG: response regulator transcription factor [Pseudomonas sp.]
MYKVLVVDDHPFIRATVCMLLRKERFEVVGQTDNGIDAVRLARELSPDLVVLDIAMPGLDGLEVIARFKGMACPPKVLVLTSQLPEAYSLRCMQAGAVGFVAKTDELDELGKAVRAALSGYTYFPEVALSSVHKQDLRYSDAQCIASLTDRELMVLQQLARGLSNKAIGEAMLLSNKTISTYKARLMEKLRVNSLIDLADFARRNALI